MVAIPVTSSVNGTMSKQTDMNVYAGERAVYRRSPAFLLDSSAADRPELDRLAVGMAGEQTAVEYAWSYKEKV